jgi:alginate O-acetyltransferase complex protein AlgI
VICVAVSLVTAWWTRVWHRRRRLYQLWVALATVIAPLATMRATAEDWPLIVTLGVGFFPLKSVSVLIDSYRGQRRTPVGQVFLLNLFFPIYSAGPVERLETFDLERFRARFSIEDAYYGTIRIALGLFKSVFIADMLIWNLLVARWPNIAEDAGQYGVTSVYVFIVLRFLYTYINFSAYMDIAIGVARLLSIPVMENFNLPILARNLQDFWHRWHISLGNWVTRYLFFPLVATVRRAWAIPVAFVLSFFAVGVWHDATWPWICWGLFHGVGRAVVSQVRRFGRNNVVYQQLAAHPLYILACWGLTLFYVSFVQTFANMPTVAAGSGIAMRLIGL